MRFSVMQENMKKGLDIVKRAVPSRPTLPILSNVLLSTDAQRLKLSATTLDFGITCWIGAKIDQEGATTVPAATFSDLVGNLSPERIDFELSPRNQVLNLRCGGTTANIKCVDATEFPLVPQADTSRGVAIPAELFKEMVRHVEIAAAREDNRPILTGILTRFEEDLLTMAAADGFRLSVRTAVLENPVEEYAQVVIPARVMSEVAKIISDNDKEVLISLPEGRSQVMFHLHDVDISSSLIEGNFPDYEAIIPRNHQTSTQVYTEELLRACKRSEVFAKDSANAARILISPASSGPGRVMVAAKSQEKGDNEGLVDADVKGDEVEISFNIKYLIEVLQTIKEDQVVIETNGNASPGMIRPQGRDDFLHVIMPMSGGR